MKANVKVKVNVKKNDQVLVTTGKDRGAHGRVLRVLASDGKAIVERVMEGVTTLREINKVTFVE